MKRLLFGMLAAATFAGCSAAALLSDLNRMLVSGTVLLDGIAEPATVHLFRQSTGEIADSEPTDSIGFYELADEWEGFCDWRVEVEFTNIVADSAFLADLSGPLVVEDLACSNQTVDFDLTTN